MKHPMQPIVFINSVARFQANEIIQWLFNNGKINLNDIALMNFSNEDRMQLDQLLGYSVSGFGDLEYADDEVVRLADAEVERLIMANSP
jgi:hypothetical protein